MRVRGIHPYPLVYDRQRADLRRFQPRPALGPMPMTPKDTRYACSTLVEQRCSERLLSI